MAENTANVSAGKPKIGGAAYKAPVGSTLPTDATTALDAAFVALGYISEEGLTNSNSPSSTEVKAWGGATVLSIQNGRPDTLKFKLIEALNPDVLKVAYGEDAVTGTLTAGIKVEVSPGDLENMCWVFEMVLKGGALKRVVVPEAKLTALEDIVYGSGAIGYGVTLTANLDSSGKSHYEYIKAGSCGT